MINSVTDSSLRELERRFRASGSVEDEAAWLRARLQAGELSEGRLCLARFCQHAAAQIVLGADAPTLSSITRGWAQNWAGVREDLVRGLRSASAERDPPKDARGRWRAMRRVAPNQVYREQAARALELLDAAEPAASWLIPYDWVTQLQDKGREVSIRAGVAGARVHTWPEEEEAALRAVEAWILGPSAERRMALISAPARFLALSENRWESAAIGLLTDLVVTPDERPGTHTHRLPSLFLDLVALARDAVFTAAPGANTIPNGPSTRGRSLASGFPDAGWAVGEWRAQDAIWNELIPWTLGYRDPIRERVDAREAAAD
jgi:hypothetical protein